MDTQATRETHLIHTIGTGMLTEAEVTTSVPAGYAVAGSALDHSDALYRIEQAGYSALYRRADGKVTARSNVSAQEAGDIYWSDKRRTNIYIWIGR